MGKGLTAKQQAFVNEFLKDFNATRAYRDAGYARNNAHRNGPVLRQNKAVAAEIDRLIDERMMKAEEVHLRWGRAARFDLSPYITSYGKVNYVDLEQLIADGWGDMIVSIKHTQHGDVIEFRDGQKALESIAKAQGMFVNKTEITGADGGKLVIEYVNDWRKSE